MRLERSVERWSKCDPKVMQHMSPAAVYFAMQDAKHDIASLAKALETARLEMNRAYERHNAERATMRAQLAARDAVLDMVVSFAKIVRVRENAEIKEWADELLALLTKHGVHPK